MTTANERRRQVSDNYKGLYLREKMISKAAIVMGNIDFPNLLDNFVVDGIEEAVVACEESVFACWVVTVEDDVGDGPLSWKQIEDIETENKTLVNTKSQNCTPTDLGRTIVRNALRPNPVYIFLVKTSSLFIL